MANKRIPFTKSGILCGDYYALNRIIESIRLKLGVDISKILESDSSNSPTGFLKRAYSQSSSTRVYYAPRKQNDGYPKRNNTLKNVENFSHGISESYNPRGFIIEDHVRIDHGGKLIHKSMFGKTKDQAVYPWMWVDQGTTYRNRFTGNPRSINQTFTRDWHSQGYRDIFINKLGSQLRKKGWDVSK